MKKILVTGGAGFLGSHLCRDLHSQGHHIICLDNLFTGNLDNIKDLENSDRFQFINHNVIEPIDLEIDEIYNLACPASPIHYQADPIFTMKTSVWGAYNMLELAKKNKAKILQTSTSEVYGDPEVHPQPESYKGSVNPIGIRACYDEGKRTAETLFFDYQRKYNLDIKVVRIFNTYGPNMHPQDGRVVSNFIVQALKGEDITIYGDGSQTRSFCYVQDLVDVIISMMNSSEPGPVNIGNPGEFTIKELAEIVLEMTKSSSQLTFHDLPSDDPKVRRPNIALAKEKLNWEPKVDLKSGLSKTIKYFQSL